MPSFFSKAMKKRSELLNASFTSSFRQYSKSPSMLGGGDVNSSSRTPVNGPYHWHFTEPECLLRDRNDHDNVSVGKSATKAKSSRNYFRRNSIASKSCASTSRNQSPIETKNYDTSLDNIKFNKDNFTKLVNECKILRGENERLVALLLTLDEETESQAMQLGRIVEENNRKLKEATNGLIESGGVIKYLQQVVEKQNQEMAEMRVERKIYLRELDTALNEIQASQERKLAHQLHSTDDLHFTAIDERELESSESTSYTESQNGDMLI